MAYRYGNREQISFLPASVEEYVSPNDPVRVYDAFVDQLDIDGLGLSYEETSPGNPSYDPVSMLKLLVYGYSYGERSGRRLERALHHNMSFIWLVGGLKPDYRTITRFRRSNTDALRKVLKHCAQLCFRLDLIEGNTLFVDGTKLKANASSSKTWTNKRCKRVMSAVSKRIDEILAECEAVDSAEENSGSLVSLGEELQEKHALLERVKEIAAELSSKPPQKSGSPSLNTTDVDSERMRSNKGNFSGYNAQSVVDGKHGLIVSTDVVTDSNDLEQFSNQITQAEETISKECDCAVADAGYHSLDKLYPLYKRGTQVVVPTQQQASKKEAGDYDKSRFEYNDKDDCYHCPCGFRLTRKRVDSKKRKIHYGIKDTKKCQACQGWGPCTKSKNGRTVTRFFDEKIREELMKDYERETTKMIFSKRKELAERPFAHMRANLGINSFLLRGIKGVQAEMALIGNAFNIRRIISILGVEGFIKKVQPV